MWGDISVWKVQNLKRLIDKQIWVQICDSISHIENVRHLMEEKHKILSTHSPWPSTCPVDCICLAKEIFCQQYWWQEATWMWLSEWAERVPARVLTERDEGRGKMKGNEVTWKKTNGSNWFYSITQINVAELRVLSESYILVLLFKCNILCQHPNLTF